MKDFAAEPSPANPLCARIFTSIIVLVGVGSATWAQQQQCESVISLSKVVSTVVSDQEAVESHAANFCSEYAKSTGESRSLSFSASYKFLSASLGLSSASYEDVASKYCSASNSSMRATNAYKQYVESISPEAYDAYKACLDMSTKKKH